MSDITITLHDPATGRSESLPLSNSMTLQEILDLGVALLGLNAGGSGKLVVAKDGKPLLPLTNTLAQAGVANGDLLAVVRMRPAPRSPAAASGGLDFSNLLGGNTSQAPAPAASGGLDFSSLLLSGGGGSSASNTNNPWQSNTPNTPVYYPGMSFEEAVASNPHPKVLVELLRKHDHLMKECNYHAPHLAQQLRSAPSFEAAVEIWRKELVTNSIAAAAATSETFHKERAFRQRLSANPNDAEAKAYFDKKESQKLVDEQYRQALQEYPESMGRVLMLYINAKINHHPLQAFVDSGAQMTVMSKSCAQRCGIFHLLDTRFHGMAVGVGTGKILGRIHIVQLQIGDYHFPCQVTVMDDATLPRSGDKETDAAAAKPKDMDLLLGLDMLKRFNCSIDLLEHKLKFRLGGSTLETPFLHEKDLDETKGGTKGFDATKANRELEAARQQAREAREQAGKKQSGKDGGGGDAMKDA